MFINLSKMFSSLPLLVSQLISFFSPFIIGLLKASGEKVRNAGEGIVSNEMS